MEGTRRYVWITIAWMAICLGVASNSQEFGFLKILQEPKDEFRSDERFLAMVQKYQQMHRVTEKPYLMHADLVVRCSFPIGDPPPDPFKSTVHGDSYCDVFVSEGVSRVYLKTGEERMRF